MYAPGKVHEVGHMVGPIVREPAGDRPDCGHRPELAGAGLARDGADGVPALVRDDHDAARRSGARDRRHVEVRRSTTWPTRCCPPSSGIRRPRRGRRWPPRPTAAAITRAPCCCPTGGCCGRRRPAARLPVTDQTNAQIYSPPYLFKGLRPQINSAPSTVQHGSSFTVGTSRQRSIRKVSLVRLGSRDARVRPEPALRRRSTSRRPRAG